MSWQLRYGGDNAIGCRAAKPWSPYDIGLIVRPDPCNANCRRSSTPFEDDSVAAFGLALFSHRKKHSAAHARTIDNAAAILPLASPDDRPIPLGHDANQDRQEAYRSGLGVVWRPITT